MPLGVGDEKFQVELFVELRRFLRHAVGQQFAPHGHQQPVVAGAVADQGVLELGRHERGVAGLRQGVAQQFGEFLPEAGSVKSRVRILVPRERGPPAADAPATAHPRRGPPSTAMRRRSQRPWPAAVVRQAPRSSSPGPRRSAAPA